MNSLIVQLIEPSMPNSEWTVIAWLFNNNFDLLASAQGIEVAKVNNWVNEQQKTHNLPSELSLIALAPAKRGHVRTLALKKGQIKYINQVTPVLMEPFLAQPIEDVHFTNKLMSSEQLLVCAVSRHHMNLWYDILGNISSLSKTLILPQVLLVNILDKKKELFFLDEGFQLSEGHIFTWPADLLDTSDQATTRLGVEYLTKQIAGNAHKQCNLLHSDFAYKLNNSRLVPFWKTATALFFIALTVSCGWLYSQILNDTKQADYIEKKTQDAFLTLVPEEGRIVNLRRQIEGRIRNLSTQATKQNSSNSPYAVLNLIDKARTNTEGENALQLIAYRDGVYILEWQSKRQETLEVIRTNLEIEKLKAYLDQVVKNNEGYVGSYRIQGVLK